MKKLSSPQLALSFAGFFLGAGYVSGQELWQFFGQFGARGFIGLIIAMAMIFLSGLVTLSLSRITGQQEADKLIVMKDIPALRRAVAVLELLLLFGVVCIMTAGVGSLFETVLSVPSFAASLIFTVIIVIISFTGFQGMVSAFSFTVPVLCVFCLYFGLGSVFENGLSFQPVEHSNGLLSSWFVAAFSFFFYNIFGSIALIAPLGDKLRAKRSSVIGIGLGTLLLLLIAVSVLAVVCSTEGLSSEALPMLSYCLEKSPVSGYIYAVLLLFAMFGTALSCLVGFMHMLGLKIRIVGEHGRAFTILFAALAFFGSLFGFGGLIGTIYPLFGYCSSVFIVMMFINRIRVEKLSGMS